MERVIAIDIIKNVNNVKIIFKDIFCYMGKNFVDVNCCYFEDSIIENLCSFKLFL